MKNLAAELVAQDGLDYWDGHCMEIADELLQSHPDALLLWVEPLDWYDLPGTTWQYHAVIVLDGVVHDAWFPDAMLPPAKYIEQVFGGRAHWELNPGQKTEYGSDLSGYAGMEKR